MDGDYVVLRRRRLQVTGASGPKSLDEIDFRLGLRPPVPAVRCAPGCGDTPQASDPLWSARARPTTPQARGRSIPLTRGPSSRARPVRLIPIRAVRASTPRGSSIEVQPHAHSGRGGQDPETPQGGPLRRATPCHVPEDVVAAGHGGRAREGSGTADSRSPLYPPVIRTRFRQRVVTRRQMWMPPATSRRWALTQPISSERSAAITSPTSSGRPARPRAVGSPMRLFNSECLSPRRP